MYCSAYSAVSCQTDHGVHLVIAGNVFVQRAQHDHSHHTGQEEHDDQGVHYTAAEHMRTRGKTKQPVNTKLFTRAPSFLGIDSVRLFYASSIRTVQLH